MVCPRRLSIWSLIALGLLRRVRGVADVLDRQQRMPVPALVDCSAQPACELEPPVVDLTRDEPADVGLHPPGLVEEDAAFLGIVASPPSRCSSTLASVPGGWLACETCGSWQRIAEQDQVARRGAGTRSRRRARAGRPRRSRGSRARRPNPRARTARSCATRCAASHRGCPRLHDLAGVEHAAGRVLGSACARRGR